jgi:hypothetical protein
MRGRDVQLPLRDAGPKQSAIATGHLFPHEGAGVAAQFRYTFSANLQSPPQRRNTKMQDDLNDAANEENAMRRVGIAK